MMDRKPVITVVGSSNTDMVVITTSLPRPGETLLGGKFFMSAGGKGANQAVAAARRGGDVFFIANTGNVFQGAVRVVCIILCAIHGAIGE